MCYRLMFTADSCKYWRAPNGHAKKNLSFMKFNFTTDGEMKAMDFDVRYKSGMLELTKTTGKNVHVSAKYAAKVYGKAHDRKVYSGCFSAMETWMLPKGIYAAES